MSQKSFLKGINQWFQISQPPSLDHTLPSANTWVRSFPNSTELFSNSSSPRQAFLNSLLPMRLTETALTMHIQPSPLLLNPKVKSESSPSLTYQSIWHSWSHLPFPGFSPFFLLHALRWNFSSGCTHSLCVFTQSHGFKYNLHAQDSQIYISGLHLSHPPHIYPTTSLTSCRYSKGLSDWRYRALSNLSPQTCFSLHLPHFSKWQLHCASYLGQKSGSHLGFFLRNFTSYPSISKSC